MRGTMLIFEPGAGNPRAQEFTREPKLEEVRAAVGNDDLEVIGGFTTIGYGGIVLDCIALCGEHGKLRNKPVNELATALWEQALRRKGETLQREDRPPVDYLVGQVAVFFGDREFMASL